MNCNLVKDKYTEILQRMFWWPFLHLHLSLSFRGIPHTCGTYPYPYIYIYIHIPISENVSSLPNTVPAWHSFTLPEALKSLPVLLLCLGMSQLCPVPLILPLCPQLCIVLESYVGIITLSLFQSSGSKSPLALTWRPRLKMATRVCVYQAYSYSAVLVYQLSS